jgi:glycogen(starch) synthase
MTHLILCREYPPAPYPAGGIGAYAHHIARLLAEAGETVHMIAQRWEGATDRIAKSIEGRLIVHRISPEEPIPGDDDSEQRNILKLLANSTCPTQVFSWQAARYAERLIETEPIDIIEAQEWEAPLYYLQARRAVGLGPSRHPPCIVHLHSPTRMIFEYNDWDQTLTDFLPLARFEEFSIRAADALLCPSHYLANQISQRFNLVSDCVGVIPYPMGVETPIIERAPEVWSRDAICYVGRLELRKGVIEWVVAAVTVAATHPTVSFDFFGSDTSIGGGAGQSVLSFLKKRIPSHMQSRFRFHGSRSRSELMQALAQFSVAVVPSRWENFPFSCIEAMSTGMPVLASPNGGMAEMIADNQSGWIASDGSASGLAAALARVLSTPADRRAAMGAHAAQTIRRICDNDTVVARHIAFRARVASSSNPIPRHSGPTTPWVLYGEDDLDPGPSADALTWPGPPIECRPPRKQPLRRYSGMALIANQSAGFALKWFLGAPFTEKLRWLSRIATKPQRAIRWLRWRLRS